jgi:hypothetical protein
VLITGCDAANDRNGVGDAPVGKTDESPADVINMPDGFANVATKCIPFQPGKRLYERREQPQPIIVDDPACGGTTSTTATTSTSDDPSNPTGTALR